MTLRNFSPGWWRQVGDNAKLSQSDRDRLIRSNLSRTVVLLREAVDTSPKLAEKVKNDGDFRGSQVATRFSGHTEYPERSGKVRL